MHNSKKSWDKRTKTKSAAKSTTQNTTQVTQLRLPSKKYPELHASYDTWPGNEVGQF